MHEGKKLSQNVNLLDLKTIDQITDAKIVNKYVLSQKIGYSKSFDAYINFARVILINLLC